MDLGVVSFPALLVADNGSWLQGVEGREDITRWSLAGISKYKQRTVILYDARDRVWRIQDVRPVRAPTIGEWILSRFSRKSVPVEISIEPGEGDPLKVTKDLVLKAIDRDDDILTQFIEPNELKAAVEQATSFETLYHALKETRSIW